MLATSIWEYLNAVVRSTFRITIVSVRLIINTAIIASRETQSGPRKAAHTICWELNMLQLEATIVLKLLFAAFSKYL